MFTVRARIARCHSIPKSKNNMSGLSFVTNLIYSGLGNLASHLAAHVLFGKFINMPRNHPACKRL